MPGLDVLREEALIAFGTDETYTVLMCRMATTILAKRRSVRTRHEQSGVLGNQERIKAP